ncbi:hypothetical protein [Nostoc favosum]|uniref:Uncharacterized protein n=1 Tax=Nostoc favosum CHAB5714 TaxID=2780399 RepID=A0ABS8IHJ2_9NOSO|nr:hypothetical protein [Nostoc favosum]MCC5603654.1 hypothetical protein [Nostoc favosum CHAB5714]
MMNFKIQGFFTTLIIGTVSALTISDAISQKVNAQATPSCNNVTIKGSYGTKFTGTFETENLVAVGLVKFNGNRNFQGTDVLSINGTVSPNRPLSGTYSVKQDCTVQIVLTSGSNTASYSGIIVDGGKEIFLIQTTPGSLITGTLKKVN